MLPEASLRFGTVSGKLLTLVMLPRGRRATVSLRRVAQPLLGAFPGEAGESCGKPRPVLLVLVPSASVHHPPAGPRGWAVPLTDVRGITDLIRVLSSPLVSGGLWIHSPVLSPGPPAALG